MRAKRATGIVVLAAGVAAAGLLVVWLFLAAPDSGDPAAEAEASGRTGESVALPLLAGRGGDVTVLPSHSALATLRGEVRRGGLPASAAVEIRVAGGPGSTRSGSVSLGGRRPHLNLFVGMREGEPTASASSGEDGRFTVAGLSPGTYEARAVAGDGVEGFALFEVREGDFATVRIELPAGPESIRGRAVHSDGRAFSGWVVAIPYQEHHDDEHADLSGGATVATDGEGRFHLRGLLPGPYILSALVPGRFRNVLTVIPAPHARDVLLVVDGGLTEVAGRVLAAKDGRPVPYARVLATATDVPGWFAEMVATADGEGRFQVLTSPRSFDLLVEAPGFAQTRRTFVRPVGEVVVRLPRPSRVEGLVVAADDGRGVAGAVVWLVTESLGRLRTTSGADGRFAFTEGPVTASAEVYVLGGGWASRGIEALWDQGLAPFRTELGPGEAVARDLPVVPAAVIEGRVLTAQGNPVSAEVRLELPKDTPYGATTSDAQGRFRIPDLPPGVEVRLVVQAREHSPARREVRLAAAGPTDVEIRLPPARWLHVLVEGGGGPLAGSRVTWYLHDPASEDDDEHEDGGEEEDEGEAQRDVHLTDAEGRARIGPLPEGRVAASATRRGYVASPKVPATSSGPLDLKVDIALDEGHVVEGRVVAPEGISPEGATVGISAGDSWWNAQVGPDGSFRFEGVPAEEAWISAMHSAGQRELTAEVQFDVAGDVHDTVLELANAEDTEPTWEVRVLDPAGRPVVGGSVVVYGAENDGGKRQISRSRVSDGTARVALEEDFWGEPIWVATSNAQDEYGRTIDAAPTSAGPFIPRNGSGEVRMDPGRSILGRVLGTDGRPVLGVFVQGRIVLPVRGARGPMPPGAVLARTDAEGRFRLRGLADADYDVRVGPPTGHVQDAAQRVAAGSEGITLRLRAALEVAVTVLDPTGSPLRGASVVWRPEDTPEGGIDPYGSTTDASGVARFTRFDPEARYELRVRPPDAREDLGEPPPRPAPAEDLVVVLPRGLSIRGVVRGEAGEVSRSVLIWASPDPEEGHDSVLWTAEDGTFTLTRLAPGRQHLCATRGRDPGREAPWTVVEAGASNVVLPLYDAKAPDDGEADEAPR